MLDEPLPEPTRPRPRWWKILAVVLVVPLVLLAYLWFAIPPKVSRVPAHLTRGEDGELVSADEKSGNGVFFEAQSGAIESRTISLPRWAPRDPVMHILPVSGS